MSDPSKVCSRLGDGAAGVVMKAPLAILDGCWLETRCDCGRVVVIGTRLLAGRFGGDWPLSEVISRATCKQCGGKPGRVYLNETPNRDDCHGAPPGWSVQLIPAPAPVSYAEAAE